MRAFVLVRDVDVSGISGVGVVAEGVEFIDGTVAVRWLPIGTSRPAHVKPTTVLHPDIDNVIGLHGHNGSTRVEFLGSNLLMPFSEWLDANGLMVSPEGDDRTHEDLVRQFLEERPGAQESPDDEDSDGA